MVKLILIRHGQSIWNLQNRFTGCVDVSLSKKGMKEAKEAGNKLKKYKFDLAFSSKLIRAQETLYKILDVNKNCDSYLRVHDGEKGNWYNQFTQSENEENELVIRISPALNERYYGALQGKNKDEVRKQYGEEQVHIWRRSFEERPPRGESLKQTSARVVPYYKENILPELKKGKNVIISAHGNSLRALIMSLENLSAQECMELELATGTPIIYELDEKSKNLTIKSKLIL